VKKLVPKSREDKQASSTAPGGEPVVLGMWQGPGVGDMRINWSAPPDEGGPYLVTYTVLRGSIAALTEGRYDHELAASDACGISLHEALLPDQAGGSHYSLVAVVAGDNATFGYDWSGQERPAAEVCYLHLEPSARHEDTVRRGPRKACPRGVESPRIRRRLSTCGVEVSLLVGNG